jgi:uncharacterized protein
VSPATVLTVRVTPRAGRTAISGWHESPRSTPERTSPVIQVKLAAAPVDGAANDALVALLAKSLDLPKRAIRLVSGERSRTKRIEIDGLTLDDVTRRLGGR